MNRITGFIVLFILVSSPIFAQGKGPLTFERRGLNWNYYYDGLRLDRKAATDSLRLNPESAEVYLSSRNLSNAALVFAAGSVICSFGCAYFLISSFFSWLECNGKAVSEFKTSVYWELAGGVFVVGSLLCLTSSLDRQSISIKLFNENVRSGNLRYDAILSFGITGSGFGIRLRF